MYPYSFVLSKHVLKINDVTNWTIFVCTVPFDIYCVYYLEHSLKYIYWKYPVKLLFWPLYSPKCILYYIDLLYISINLSAFFYIIKSNWNYIQYSVFYFLCLLITSCTFSVIYQVWTLCSLININCSVIVHTIKIYCNRVTLIIQCNKVLHFCRHSSLWKDEMYSGIYITMYSVILYTL